jgi:hypothetical protein
MLPQHVVEHLILQLLNAVGELLNMLVIVAEPLHLDSMGAVRNLKDSSIHLSNMLIGGKKEVETVRCVINEVLIIMVLPNMHQPQIDSPHIAHVSSGTWVIFKVDLNVLGRYITAILIADEEWDVVASHIELIAIRDRGDGMVGL